MATSIKQKPESEINPASQAHNGAAAVQKQEVAVEPNAAVKPTSTRKWLWVVMGIAAVGAVCVFGVPWLREMFNTVSTDDAYVNGDVTYVAPRVSGQVSRVLVKENNVVRKGQLLVELDPEPYQVQVDIAQAAVAAAKAELVGAQATVRSNEGLVRSLQFEMQRAMDDVNDKVATLKLRIATLESKKASLTKASADYKRNQPLVAQRAVSQQDMDKYTEAYLVAQAET